VVFGSGGPSNRSGFLSLGSFGSGASARQDVTESRRSFSVQSVLLQILQSQDALVSLNLDASDGDLGRALGQLSSTARQRLEGHWGREGLEELINLSHETHPESFYETLLSLAGRLQREERLPLAMQLYGLLRQGLSAANLPGLQARVQGRIDALEGRGAILPRLEMFGRQLVSQATDPAMIAGMGFAGVAFRTSRLLALSRLAMSPLPRILSQGLGASLIAGTAGFLVEAPVFTAAVRGANHLLGREQDWSGRGIWREFASGAITLFSLKVMGGATGTGLQRMNAGLNPLEMGVGRRIAATLLPQLGTYVGILGGHVLETRLGLRESRPGSSIWAESLATYVNLAVGGRVAQEAMGPGMQRMEQALEERSERVMASVSNVDQAREGRGVGMLDALRSAALAPMWMMMGAGGIGAGTGVPRGRRGRVQREARESVVSNRATPIIIQVEGGKVRMQEEIDTVLRAIVTQDKELYPEGSAVGMTGGQRFFRDRWYQVQGEDLTLNTLACRERQARGLLANDTKSLPNSQILGEWKNRVWGIRDISRAHLVLTGEFQFADPRRWTQAEIDMVLRAIVAQDSELYPEGSAARMSMRAGFFQERWYRVVGEDLTLSTLVGRERQARGLRADNFKSLSGSQIIQEWKRRIWGIETEGTARECLEISGNFVFTDPKQWTQAEIDTVLRAIVAEDRDFYPKGSPLKMNAGRIVFAHRWYRVGGEEFTLNSLARRERQARGLRADDTKSLPGSQILKDWKRRIWGIEESSQADLEITGEFQFANPRRWTQAEIDTVLRAIVSQDRELYPEGSAMGMSTSEKFLIDRSYRVGLENLTLNTLASRERRSRGLSGKDTKSLPASQILQEWKRRIWGVDESSRVDLEITGEFQFANPKRWTQGEIDTVLRAIVSQDRELYPEGSGVWMNSGKRFSVDRRYRVGGEDLMLLTLIRRERSSRGLLAGDTKSLPDVEVLRAWKARIWGIETGEIARDSVEIRCEFQFGDSKHWTQAEIDRVLRAIVDQDLETYPGGSAAGISKSERFFRNRWYRVNGENLTVKTLAGRERMARGLKSRDEKSLPGPQIWQEWKRRIWGIEESSQADLVIAGKFQFANPRVWTQSEIDTVLRAIVAQDRELYPEGSAVRMNTGASVRDRLYRLNDQELTIETLAARERRARGMRPDDRKALPNAQIIREWKRRIWGIETAQIIRSPLEITGEFQFANQKQWSQSEIDAVLRAIVAQDRELFPEGSAVRMNTGARFFDDRWYRINGQDLKLPTLIGRERHARGLGTNDTKSLPNSQVLRDWKSRIWGIEDFAGYSPGEIKSFLEQEGLSNVFELFAMEPSALVEAVEFLRPEKFANSSASDLVRRYVGLQVEGGDQRRATAINPEPYRTQAYVQMVVEAIRSGRKLDLLETSLRRQVGLMLRLTRRAFAENPDALLAELGSLAETSPHEFSRRLCQGTAQYYRELQSFEPHGMRHRGFAYQREGARFLSTHDRAILADEAGMGKSYQAIAAAETLGLRRILWVTTASNKEAIREEIFTHSEVPLEQVHVVISGNPRERQAQIAGLNGERYRITNYETLRELREKDPSSYHRLTQDLDVVIVDEAQLTDNPEALRSQAVREISAPRRWLLTATPYQNRPENLFSLLNWLDPMKYSDAAAFSEFYLESPEGLRNLHRELSEYLLRRTRSEVLRYFEDPRRRSFAEQLSDGLPRIPQKFRISPDQGGSYELSPAQAEAIAWMTGDFRSWAEGYNQSHPETPIDLEGVNSLQKFQFIHRAIYQPKALGIEGENPIYAHLDRMVERRMNQGQKIILWGWNTEVIDQLEERYGHLGLRRIDGAVVGDARDRARHDFQERSNVKILVANYQSGGVGLTLTAADAELFVQLPLSYPALYQAEGRNQRLIGMENLRHAKERVESEWLVPRFSQEFIDSIEEPELRSILSHGTLVEQTRQRLEGGERLYRLVMEGIGSEADFQQEFQAGLIRGMGLDRETGLGFDQARRQQTRRIAEAAQALLPLYERTEGETRERGLRLISAFQYMPGLARRYGQLFGELRQIRSQDLAALEAVFGIGNKTLRQNILGRLPELWRQLDRRGEGLGVRGIDPLSVIGQIYRSEGLGNEAVIDTIAQLSNEPPSIMRDYVAEHLMHGVLNMTAQESAELLLAGREGLFTGAPINDRIQLIYRIGLLAQAHPESLERLNGSSFDHWGSLSRAVGGEINRAMAEIFGVELSQVEAQLQRNSDWRNNLDPLLALWNGYQSLNNGAGVRLREQYLEAIRHVFRGDYAEWRNASNAARLSYLSENPEFWAAWSRGERREINWEAGQDRESSMRAIREDIFQHLPNPPQALRDYLALASPELRTERQRQLQQDQRLLGLLFSRNENSPETEGALRRHGLSSETAQDRWRLQGRLDLIRETLDWIEIESGGGAIQTALQRRIRQRREMGDEDFVESLLLLQRTLQSPAGPIQGNLTIEDTDDPAILTRMGSIHPELQNCFNYNGSPTFNQFVTTALGSRNMRLLVIREQGRIVAIAMAKVKRLEDGRPVLFLERGLSRNGEDWRPQMLRHLISRAEQMNPRPLVMEQIEGSLRLEDPEVYGIGAYTQSEYVEPVFGLRSVNHVRHRGRVSEGIILED